MIYAPYLAKSDAKLTVTLMKIAETESYKVTESEKDLSFWICTQYVDKVSF